MIASEVDYLSELDRRTAWEIMGWAFTSVPHSSPVWEGSENVLVEDWQPTANIEQAWKCLEVMSSLGWFTSATDFTVEKGVPDWSWSLVHATYNARAVQGNGPAPLAIVQACLAAIQVTALHYGEGGLNA